MNMWFHVWWTWYDHPKWSLGMTYFIILMVTWMCQVDEHIRNDLVGWLTYPSEKIWKSDWIIIPSIGEICFKPCSKPPSTDCLVPKWYPSWWTSPDSQASHCRHPGPPGQTLNHPAEVYLEAWSQALAVPYSTIVYTMLANWYNSRKIRKVHNFWEDSIHIIYIYIYRDIRHDEVGQWSQTCDFNQQKLVLSSNICIQYQPGSHKGLAATARNGVYRPIVLTYDNHSPTSFRIVIHSPRSAEVDEIYPEHTAEMVPTPFFKQPRDQRSCGGWQMDVLYMVIYACVCIFYFKYICTESIHNLRKYPRQVVGCTCPPIGILGNLKHYQNHNHQMVGCKSWQEPGNPNIRMHTHTGVLSLTGLTAKWFVTPSSDRCIPQNPRYCSYITNLATS